MFFLLFSSLYLFHYFEYHHSTYFSMRSEASSRRSETILIKHQYAWSNVISIIYKAYCVCLNKSVFYRLQNRLQWMSEFWTSLDFRQFSFTTFPDSSVSPRFQTVLRISDSSDFRQCLNSEQKHSDFGHFFCWKSKLQKIQMGRKVWISDRKKCLKSEHLCLDFGHFLIYILPQITYCSLLIQWG